MKITAGIWKWASIGGSEWAADYGSRAIPREMMERPVRSRIPFVAQRDWAVIVGDIHLHTISSIPITLFLETTLYFLA